MVKTLLFPLFLLFLLLLNPTLLQGVEGVLLAVPAVQVGGEAAAPAQRQQLCSAHAGRDVGLRAENREHGECTAAVTYL